MNKIEHFYNSLCKESAKFFQKWLTKRYRAAFKQHNKTIVSKNQTLI